MHERNKAHVWKLPHTCHITSPVSNTVVDVPNVQCIISTECSMVTFTASCVMAPTSTHEIIPYPVLQNVTHPVRTHTFYDKSLLYHFQWMETNPGMR